jgi:ABC-type polysaccharide/polyol phosphate export permease
MAINPVLHLVELSRVAGVDGYQPMKYTSIAYPVALALFATVIGLMLYRLRYLARVTS